MNRWMAGGVLSALAFAGTAIVAAPSFADDQPRSGGLQRESDSDPHNPSPGEAVTVFDSTCFEGTTDIWWALRPDGGYEPEVVATGQVPLAEDGSWEVTLVAPDQPGGYVFFAICMPPGVQPPDPSMINDIGSADGPPVEFLEAWGVDAVVYYLMGLPVGDVDSLPTTVPETPSTVPAEVPERTSPVPATPAAPAAPAATPVSGTPTFAG